ncbi:MAG: 50S ribosomal protein L7/L12 [Enterobacteriaceae bacterium]
MSISKEKIVSEINSMSTKDLIDLIKLIESKFNISSDNYPTSSNKNIDVKKEEQQTEFSVTLKSIGTNKISVIKAIRTLIQLGLKEAKDLVESAPVLIKENLKKEEVEIFRKTLESAGAILEIK